VEAYGFQKADAIDRELGELMLAEEYLEWIGQPLQFCLVEAQEDTFNAMVLMQIDMQFKFHLFDIWKRLGFAMIKARDELDRKIMHYYPFTDPIPPQIRNWVLRSLAEDRGIVERQPLGENRQLASADADRLIPLLNEVNQAAQHRSVRYGAHRHAEGQPETPGWLFRTDDKPAQGHAGTGPNQDRGSQRRPEACSACSSSGTSINAVGIAKLSASSAWNICVPSGIAKLFA
jgi:hypothetical protein